MLTIFLWHQLPRYGSNSNMPFEENHKSDEQLTIYSATKNQMSMSHAYSYINRIPTTIFRFYCIWSLGRPHGII